MHTATRALVAKEPGRIGHKYCLTSYVMRCQSSIGKEKTSAPTRHGVTQARFGHEDIIHASHGYQLRQKKTSRTETPQREPGKQLPSSVHALLIPALDKG